MNNDLKLLGEMYSQMYSESGMIDKVKGMFSRKPAGDSQTNSRLTPQKDFLYFLNQWVSETNYPGSNPQGQRIEVVNDRDPHDTSVGSQEQYKVRGKIIVQAGGMNGAVYVLNKDTGQLARVEGGIPNQLQAAFKAFAAANSPGDVNLEKQLLQQAAGGNAGGNASNNAREQGSSYSRTVAANKAERERENKIASDPEIQQFHQSVMNRARNMRNSAD